MLKTAYERWSVPDAARRALLAMLFAAPVLALTPPFAARAAEPHLPAPMSLLHEAAIPAIMPDLLMRGANGEMVRLGAYRGKVLLINIWATWCAPCRYEMPSLARLQAELAGLPFAVLPLSLDRGGTRVVEEFYANKAIEGLPVLAGNGVDVLAKLGERAIPFSVIVDARGREIARIPGPAEWDNEAFLSYLRNLMAPPGQS